MRYKSVMITRKGGPEVLQVVENELREPGRGEARVQVLATAVGRTDVVMRRAVYPYAPRIPFVPGYQIVGRVAAVGTGVTRFSPGDCVAAITVHGGYAEYIYLPAEKLALVPSGLDLAKAVTLILNYVTAYQMLHRTARVKPGDRVLVSGASGGVGTALLELGRLAGLKVYGTASASKQAALTGLGATPIDYKSQDFVAVLQEKEPQGLDFVFDGQGGDAIRRGFAVLRLGGKLVEFGFYGLLQLQVSLLRLAWYSLTSGGKKGEFYGITALYRKDPRPFQEDLPVLFQLLGEGRLDPLIGARLPILQAAEANRLLESGSVAGQIVLLAPELVGI